MRRIKNVSLSIPAVTGPYTSVNCTLALLNSSLRHSSLLSDGEYVRQGSEDSRFIDYFGTIQSVVTSNAQNDSGMFETNLREERFLPFEGAGAESTWTLELPQAFRQFDYNTISDIILHIRYTSRQGGAQLKQKAVESIQQLIEAANTSGLVRLFSLKQDFPSEWHRFIHSDDNNFETTIKKEYFPYLVQHQEISINKVELYTLQDQELIPATPEGINLENLTSDLKDSGQFNFSLSRDQIPVEGKTTVFVVFRYSVG